MFTITYHRLLNSEITKWVVIERKTFYSKSIGNYLDNKQQKKYLCIIFFYAKSKQNEIEI